MMGRSIYFENLDGFRTLAFFIVFVTHVAGFNYAYDSHGIYGSFLDFMPNAYTGVSFFFVLSGFLITYLLLLEKIERNSINLRQFYLRRVIRIWPVYFMVVIIGFIVIPRFFEPLPRFDTEAIPVDHWYYYVLFLANFDLIKNSSVSPIRGIMVC